ncbi:MAG: hypothetical protein ACOZBL_03585 [Patescibacteria group bacterium]
MLIIKIYYFLAGFLTAGVVFKGLFFASATVLSFNFVQLSVSCAFISSTLSPLTFFQIAFSAFCFICSSSFSAFAILSVSANTANSSFFFNAAFVFLN